MKKEIDYPAEITFKSIFLHDPELIEIIRAILAEHGVDGEISHKPSRNNKYISYTIIAEFESESRLNEVCCRISAVQGFIMMI
jgi:putative lipoic acid-binding regulatory protein